MNSRRIAFDLALLVVIAVLLCRCALTIRDLASIGPCDKGIALNDGKWACK